VNLSRFFEIVPWPATCFGADVHMDDGNQQPSLWRQALRARPVRTHTADEIAARAYVKFCGRETGEADAVKDWLAAERELLEERIVARD
jgi:hypothetical protein